jgi:hypothetical protein
MSEVELGELKEIDPRVAWVDERHDFTPWLSANLSKLGAAVNLQMELDQTEKNVGPYAADILARDTVDGSYIVIENQLEGSDHRHLGQILTYLTGLNLAGLKVETVIWVSPKFSAEHLSAVRWLNDNTKEPFSFFAVKLKLVQIGTSPYAPLFEVVASPDLGGREVSNVIKDLATQRASRFFEKYTKKFPDTALDRKAGGGVSRWHEDPATDLVISYWVTQTGVALFVRGKAGTEPSTVVARLSNFQEELEKTLGTKLDHPKYPLLLSRDGDIESEQGFAEQATWLHEKVMLYKAELERVLAAPTIE